jgi:hypothetical protein
MQNASHQNLADYLRKSLRDQMNEMADHISGGGCTDYADYTRCCGVIHGLAIAERELLDLTKQIDDD